MELFKRAGVYIFLQGTTWEHVERRMICCSRQIIPQLPGHFFHSDVTSGPEAGNLFKFKERFLCNPASGRRSLRQSKGSENSNTCLRIS